MLRTGKKRVLKLIGKNKVDLVMNVESYQRSTLCSLLLIHNLTPYRNSRNTLGHSRGLSSTSPSGRASDWS